MRSLQARLFVSIAVVAVVALAIGGWWMRTAVRTELGRQIEVERTVTPQGVVEEVREVALEGSPGPRPGLVAALDRRLLLALAVVLAGAAAVTAVIARRILGPVGDLHRAARAMAGGALATRVPVKGHDEVAELGHAFNEMAATLERVEGQKRDLTNDIAHELRTPLTNLRCHVEALNDDIAQASPATFTTLLEEVLQLQRLVDDLGLLAQVEARQVPLDPEPVDLGDFNARIVQDLTARADARQVVLVSESAPHVVAAVDRGRLRQVVVNLVENAIAHTPSGGRVTLVATRAADGRPALQVADTGEGLDADQASRVFERFYRADASRSRQTGGVGLGLAIARQLVRASGGDLTVTSDRGRGSVFTVELPPA